MPVFKSTLWVRFRDRHSKFDETAKPLLGSTASAAAPTTGDANRLAIPPFLRRVSPRPPDAVRFDGRDGSVKAFHHAFRRFAVVRREYASAPEGRA